MRARTLDLVIETYNSSDYIIECIESVRGIG